MRVVGYDLENVAGATVLAEDYAGRAQIVVDDARGVIVGATFVGPEVAELLHAATIAIVGEVPLDRLWHAVPSYPTVSEVWLRLLETAGSVDDDERGGPGRARPARRRRSAVGGERPVARQHQADGRLTLTHGLADQAEVVRLEVGELDAVRVLETRAGRTGARGTRPDRPGPDHRSWRRGR